MMNKNQIAAAENLIELMDEDRSHQWDQDGATQPRFGNWLDWLDKHVQSLSEN